MKGMKMKRISVKGMNLTSTHQKTTSHQQLTPKFGKRPPGGGEIECRSFFMARFSSRVSSEGKSFPEERPSVSGHSR